ncbi:FecCD family ABC transporter permease [Parafrankia discariae]|uniref:FecCD family ABC transporter permease n=1 Tax=Parafrankia discariae TaxID=365528 RepID=UPI000369D7EA|nr:iron chelate uptake ABC transporter family permease subunit [Parafrankia discariae]
MAVASYTRASPRVTSAASRRHRRLALLLAGALLLLAVICVLSIALGSRQIAPSDVARAVFEPDGGEIDAVVRGLRVPRTVLGLFAGAALGLAGALMQGLTRNPLADPGLLGVSAGAAFGIVLAVSTLDLTSLNGYIWFAFAGALITSVVVYLLATAGRGGATPVKLALAGVAVTALLSSLTNGIALTDTEALNRYRFWAAGSLSGRDAAVLEQAAPFLAVGAVLALSSATALNSLALGEDVARSLGRRLALVRVRGVLAITLLTGAAVATAGPVVFVGLVVPHVARAITGPDYRWILPFTMILAPALVLAADILGRLINRPSEVGVGVVVAFVGAPLFILLVRRRRLAEL